MKLAACAGALARLREGRVWLLLASTDAVTTLTLFHELFMQSPSDRCLSQSLLLERLGFFMDELRAQGFELNQTPQGYITYWRTKGWLSRTLQTGAEEEEYSLTADATTAVRLMLNQLKSRNVATESRLASVMHQVLRLDDDTDTNPTTRLAALTAEKERIEQELLQLKAGTIKTLPDDRALERAREILQQANELADDFHNVKNAFDGLNQDLRASLLNTDGSRAAALSALFEGVAYVRQSAPGKTFDAFWRLLTDVEQSSALEEAIENVLSRRFAKELTSEEGRFLRNLTSRLMHEADGVQSVMRALGQSLNRFVRNDTPGANKRINDVLQTARLAALELKDTLTARDLVPFHITQSVPQIRSIAQYQLRDPALMAPAAPIAQAGASAMSLELIQGLIGQSEIDLVQLKSNIRTVLGTQANVTLAELLTHFPAEQGFGTVIGYINLGTKHGVVGSDNQTVTWRGRDSVSRSATIPAISFTQESLGTLNG